MTKSLKNELRDIISGKSEVRHGRIIQTITRYLKESTAPGSEIKGTKHFKEQETENLKSFAEKHHFWTTINFSQYVSEGAEQKVYLKDTSKVIKLNDSIYYTSWGDYFLNLLLHNYLFSDTAYELVGFATEKDILYAVIEQPYVQITEATDLIRVRHFMENNDFKVIRNNYYINEDLGIIIEDLHDENVLTKSGLLYFIDTVIYLPNNF